MQTSRFVHFKTTIAPPQEERSSKRKVEPRIRRRARMHTWQNTCIGAVFPFTAFPPHAKEMAGDLNDRDICSGGHEWLAQIAGLLCVVRA
jgi:hypothetical protein